MDDADFQGLPVSSTHTIGITKFVSLDQIDPIYYQRSYWLEPEALGRKPYMLLKNALEKTNRVAIASVSIQQKEHICAVRATEKRSADVDDGPTPTSLPGPTTWSWATKRVTSLPQRSRWP